MKFSNIFGLIISLVLLFAPISAFETDQYNLPPEPLADVGEEFTEYVEQNLKKAVEKVNLKSRKGCSVLKTISKITHNCESPERERTRLRYLQSDEAVITEVYKLLGTGFPPFTRSGSWVESHRFKQQPAATKAVI
jgi:hypothetical protein